MDSTHDGQTRALPPPMQISNNRFLFVDVAAQRAKQLRRGALPRLEAPPASPEQSPAVRVEPAHKLERIAMEEVRLGIITYELPEAKFIAAARETHA